MEGAFTKLMVCKIFALGGVGYSGMKSATEHACTDLVQGKNVDALARVLQEATWEGRLYALWAFKELDPAVYEQARAEFAGHTDRIQMQQGCIVRERTVADALERIAEYSPYK
eukprot:m.227209 g.227209  ORF g.227209 m.227209 type:complete len:113 (-) comp11552_c0_seq1:159-497(-)